MDDYIKAKQFKAGSENDFSNAISMRSTKATLIYKKISS